MGFCVPQYQFECYSTMNICKFQILHMYNTARSLRYLCCAKYGTHYMDVLASFHRLANHPFLFAPPSYYFLPTCYLQGLHKYHWVLNHKKSSQGNFKQEKTKKAHTKITALFHFVVRPNFLSLCYQSS